MYLLCLGSNAKRSYFDSFPVINKHFTLQIAHCVQAHLYLQSTLFIIHKCLSQKIYSCLMRYDQGMLYTFNTSDNTYAPHTLHQLRQSILPAEGIHTGICGVFGNRTPFLIKQTWIVKATPTAKVILQFVHFSMPYTPYCYLMGVTVTLNSTIYSKTKPRFCGTLDKWHMRSDAIILVTFFNYSPSLSTLNYGFFAYYHIEGNHTHYDTGVNSGVHCHGTYNSLCQLHSSVIITDWRETLLTSTWHIIATVEYQVIRVTCTSSKRATMEEFLHLTTFHNGPGPLSPRLQPQQTNSSATYFVLSNSFQLYISGIYTASTHYGQGTYAYIVMLKRENIICKFMAYSSSFLRSNKHQTYNQSSRKVVNLTKENSQYILETNVNNNYNLIHMWKIHFPPSQLHVPVVFTLRKFQFTGTAHRNTAADFHYKMCKLGGLFLFQQLPNGMIRQIFSWCDTNSLLSPPITKKNGLFIILFISFKGYSHGNMKATVELYKITFMHCITRSVQSWKNYIMDVGAYLTQLSLLQKQNINIHYYQSYANCYRLHIQRKIVAWKTVFNVTLRTPLGLGPTAVTIDYHSDFVHNNRLTDKSLTVHLEEGQPFHPALSTTSRSWALSPGKWQQSTNNLVSLYMTNHRHIGIDYGLQITLLVKMYCFPSIYTTNWEQRKNWLQLMHFRHNPKQLQHSIGSNLHIIEALSPQHEVPLHKQSCKDMFTDVFKDNGVIVITDVYIKSSGKPLFLRIIHNSSCSCPSSFTVGIVTISEYHSKFRMFYRYMFKLRPYSTILWQKTMVQSDVHIVFNNTAMMKHLPCHCDAVINLFSVTTYVSEPLNHLNQTVKRLTSSVGNFTHFSAR